MLYVPISDVSGTQQAPLSPVSDGDRRIRQRPSCTITQVLTPTISCPSTTIKQPHQAPQQPTKGHHITNTPAHQDTRARRQTDGNILHFCFLWCRESLLCDEVRGQESNFSTLVFHNHSPDETRTKRLRMDGFVQAPWTVRQERGVSPGCGDRDLPRRLSFLSERKWLPQNKQCVPCRISMRLRGFGGL